MQKAPFRNAIKPISEAEKHHIAPWNGLFRNAKWAISESETCDFGLWYRVYQKAIHTEMTFIMPYLTFLYISFAKIFCQNYVKKICKFASWVFTKNADIRHKERYGMYLFYEPKIHLCLTLMIYRLRHHKFIITAAPLYLCSSINSLLSHYQFILAAASIHCCRIINLSLQQHQYIVTAL